MRVKLLYSLLIFLTCCNSPPSSTPQALRINLETKPQSLDPRKARDVVTLSVLRMLFEGLTRIGKEGEVELALAETVDVSEDGLTYTFHLRDTVWSNGEAVTSSDFASSWQKVLDPAFATDMAFQLFPIRGAKRAKLGQIRPDEVSIQTPDARTLVVELESPTPYFLELVSFPSFFAVHRGLDEKTPLWMESAEHLVCNGPFILKRWEKSDLLRVEKNPLYWDASSVKLQKIDLVMVSSDTEYRLFSDGKLDWAGSPLSTLPPDSIQSLSARHSLKKSPFSGTCFLRVNTQVLSDTLLRKALSSAIDREQIATHILQGGQLPAYTFVPPNMNLKTCRTDLGKARDILAGLSALLERNPALEEGGLAELSILSGAEERPPLGEEEPPSFKRGFFKAPPMTLLYVAQERNHLIAQSLQQQLEQGLGIQIELIATERKMFVERLAKKDYQLALCSWLADFNDPISFLDVFKYRASNVNNTGWEHPKYIEWLDRSQLCRDREERRALLQDAEELLMDELPMIPLFHYALNYLQQERVKDVSLSSLGQIDFRWAHIDDGSLD